MFIEKCLSTIIASVIFVDSSFIGFHTYNKPIQPVQQLPTQAIKIVEEIIVDEQVTELEPMATPMVVDDAPEPVETVIHEPVIEEDVLGLTDSEIDLIALVTMAEAEGESEMGKRLVIDVILNRYDSSRFPNTINSVIYAKNQFECMWNGRVERCYVRDDIRKLVIEELKNRTNSNIHYFRTNHYHGFGKPVISEGNHYFSTY